MKISQRLPLNQILANLFLKSFYFSTSPISHNFHFETLDNSPFSRSRIESPPQPKQIRIKNTLPPIHSYNSLLPSSSTLHNFQLRNFETRNPLFLAPPRPREIGALPYLFSRRQLIRSRWRGSAWTKTKQSRSGICGGGPPRSFN